MWGWGEQVARRPVQVGFGLALCATVFLGPWGGGPLWLIVVLRSLGLAAGVGGAVFCWRVARSRGQEDGGRRWGWSRIGLLIAEIWAAAVVARLVGRWVFSDGWDSALLELYRGLAKSAVGALPAILVVAGTVASAAVVVLGVVLPRGGRRRTSQRHRDLLTLAAKFLEAIVDIAAVVLACGVVVAVLPRSWVTVRGVLGVVAVIGSVGLAGVLPVVARLLRVSGMVTNTQKSTNVATGNSITTPDPAANGEEPRNHTA